MRTTEPAEPGMSKRTRMRVLIGIGLVIAALFAAGVVAAIVVGDDPICADGKVPTLERPVSLGRTAYLCNDGQVVTK
jgi:hypothetical protein